MLWVLQSTLVRFLSKIPKINTITVLFSLALPENVRNQIVVEEIKRLPRLAPFHHRPWQGQYRRNMRFLLVIQVCRERWKISANAIGLLSRNFYERAIYQEGMTCFGEWYKLCQDIIEDPNSHKPTCWTVPNAVTLY